MLGYPDRSLRRDNRSIGLRKEARGPAFAKPSSQPTLRWREMDSKFRFRTRGVSAFPPHTVAETIPAGGSLVSAEIGM
jgi:hypothetical protein